MCDRVCRHVWCILQVNTLLAATHHDFSILPPGVMEITAKDDTSATKASVANE